jgi:hypothetical protein
MSKKTKIAEMKRLRATEMTLANAARLSQDRRGPGRAFAAADGLAMVLIGGIVALGFVAQIGLRVSFPFPRRTQPTASVTGRPIAV